MVWLSAGCILAALALSPGVSAVIAIIVTVSIVRAGAERSTSRSDRRPSSLHIEQVVAWFSTDCSILRAAPSTTSRSHTFSLHPRNTHWLACLTSPTHNSYEATPKAVGEPREVGVARSSVHPSVHLSIHPSVGFILPYRRTCTGKTRRRPPEINERDR